MGELTASRRVFSLEDMPTIHLPKRTNLMVTNWCRISWYGQKVGPAVRFHFSAGKPGGTQLGFKFFRLDASFHRYVPDGYPRKVFPWLSK